MDIAALEQALRKAFQANPSLALAGATGLSNIELPGEFARAAKTLTSRSGSNLGATKAEVWA